MNDRMTQVNATLGEEVERYRPEIVAFLDRNGVKALPPEMQKFLQAFNELEVMMFCWIPMLDAKIHEAEALAEESLQFMDDIAKRRIARLLADFREMKDELVAGLGREWPYDEQKFRFLGDTSLYHF